METEVEFKSIKKLVENLLETDIRCRNDDRWLTYKVFRHYTKIFIPFEDFSKLPAFETVKRCRAKIQNDEGRFPSTEESAMKRRKRQGEVRNWTVDN